MNRQRAKAPVAGARANLLAHLLALTGPRPRIAVAYSGGLDSTVLADALVGVRGRLGALRLVHVDHGLQAASGDWSAHCARQAKQWRVPIRCLRAQIKGRRGESPEAAAREARYELFARELEPGEVLVTAHHLDDQVETFFLQLLRGAGVTGLAAMPERRKFAAGFIVRPLLDVSRADLLAHAGKRRLSWIEDPTNHSTRYGRNYLRHEVLPILRKRWLGFDSIIARTARHMAEASKLLDAHASSDLAGAMDGPGLNVAALRRLPGARRRNVLRLFVARAGLELPSTAQMTEIAGSLLAARSDAQPEVSWAGAVMRRRSGRLELVVKSEASVEPDVETPCKSWRWNEDRELRLNTGDRLRLVNDPAGAIDLERLPATLELRARQGGESLRPSPQARTRTLKKLLQAARLTVEQRARLPLLFGAGPKGRLIAVGDRWLDASVMATVKSRRRARLVWSRRKD
jgi:tRNA(Ile)-lysidine synthase